MRIHRAALIVCAVIWGWIASSLGIVTPARAQTPGNVSVIGLPSGGEIHVMTLPNPDSDGDGIRNLQDTDDDNDGVADLVDAFALDPTEWADFDRDGIGDNADPDDSPLAAFLQGPSSAYAQALLAPLLIGALDLSGATELVGALAGDLEADAGSAAFTVPIGVPPGTAGIQPQLAIVLSSPADSGLLGMGGSIAGLSSISRCGVNLVPDGAIDPIDFDTNDRFCLDGQRLIPTPDGYRTEIDSFTKIVASGGTATNPATFTVYTKDARILEFGGTTDSRIEAAGRTDVLVWALNRNQDRFGNYFTVSYGEVNALGFFTPLRIDYTGNAAAGLTPYNSVRFRYQNRADHPFGFVAGSQVSGPLLLKQIETYAGSTPVRAYALGYATSPSTGRPRVTSVRECGFNSGGTPACLRPTALGWQDAAPGFVATSLWTSFPSSQQGELSYADFNGDGRDDVIFRRSDNHWFVGLSNGTSFTAPSLWLTHGGSLGDGTAAYPDLNGDGLSDLVYYNVLNQFFVSLSTGTSFTPPALWMTHGGSGQPSYVDVNADGRGDLVFRNVNNQWYVSVSTGSSFASPALWMTHGGNLNDGEAQYPDLDGDGRGDLVYRNVLNQFFVSLSTGASFAPAQLWLQPSGSFQNDEADYGDFNADGLADLVYRAADNRFRVAFSTGAGFSTPAQWMQHGGTAVRGQARYPDVNGDGRSDLVYQSTSNEFYVQTSSGQGFGAATIWTTHGGPFDTSLPAYADPDGNGLTDLMFRGIDNSIYASLRGQPFPDLLTSALNALGAQTLVDYGSLSDPNLYTKGTTAVYPVVDLQDAPAVVAQLRSSDGIGGLQATLFRYTRLQFDAHRRLRLGFRTVTATDPARGVMLTSVYSQVFPGNGQAEVTEKRLFPQNVLLARTAHTWTMTSELQIPSDPSSYTHRVLPTSTLEERWETTGAFIGATATTRIFDAYGNITRNEVTSYDGLVQTTLSDYQNDTPTWLLGKLTRAEEQTQSPGFPLRSRVTEFTYVPNRPVLQTQIVEPSLPQLRIETAFTYDAFGHAVTSTVSGYGLAPRTAQTTYDSRGIYEVLQTNELGHTQTNTYDDRFGVVTSRKGANAAVPASTFAFDPLGRETLSIVAGVTTTVSRSFCGTCPPRAIVQLTTTPGAGSPTTTYLDALERTVRTETLGFDGQTVRVDTEYDALGRLMRSSLPYFTGATVYSTTLAYDALDRMVSETAPDGSTTTLTYAGATTSVTNALGQTKLEVRDSQGRRTLVRDPLGGEQQFVYDPFGNNVAIVDALGTRIEADFDVRGRRTLLRDPDAGERTFEYNAGGELTRQVDAKGQVVTLQYDLLGRPVQRMAPEGETTWEYDTATNGIGLLRRLRGPTLGYDEIHTYDGYARPASTAIEIAGASYTQSLTYDAVGRPLTSTYPSGFAIRKVYNARGYLEAVENVATSDRYWTATAQDARGSVIEQRLGANLVTQHELDPATGRLERITTQNGTTPVQDLSFAWDAIGNLVSRVDVGQGLEEVFTYDVLNRLTNAAVTGGPSMALTYNAVGSITSKTGLGTFGYGTGGVRPHAVVSTSSGSMTYGYDANGNMTSSSTGRAVSYTSFDKPMLIQQTSGGSTAVISNAYGPDAQLIRRIELTGAPGVSIMTTFAGSQFEVVVEANGDVVQKHHIPGSAGVVAAVHTLRNGGSPTTLYFERDHLGSVDAIADAAGAVLERRSYDAHGKSRDPVDWDGAASFSLGALDQGFTGHHQLQSVALVDMGARSYDPSLGRFISPDPALQLPDSTQGLNPYTYVNNNPLSFVDPTGYGLSRYLKKAADSARRALRNTAEVIVKLTEGSGSFVGASFSNFLTGNPGLKYKGDYIALRYIAAGGSIGEAARELGKVYATFGVAILAIIAQQYYVLPAVTAVVGAGTSLAAGGVASTSVITAISNTVLPQVISGAIVGGASAGAIAAINGENVGRAIGRGAVVGAATGFVSALARFTRYIEIRSTESVTGNPPGLSDGGPVGDGLKKAGGRVLRPLADGESEGFVSPLERLTASSSGESFLGGNEAGQGTFFGFKYPPNGIVNYALESYAGPHDFIQRIFGLYEGGYYTRFHGVGGFFLAQLAPFINILGIAPATPFAVSLGAAGLPAAADAFDFSSARDLQKERNLP